MKRIVWFMLLLPLLNGFAAARYRDDAGGAELAMHVACALRTSDRDRHYLYMKGAQKLMTSYLAALKPGSPDDYVLLNYQSVLHQIDSWSTANVMELCDDLYKKGRRESSSPSTLSEPK